MSAGKIAAVERAYEPNWNAQNRNRTHSCHGRFAPSRSSCSPLNKGNLGHERPMVFGQTHANAFRDRALKNAERVTLRLAVSGWDCLADGSTPAKVSSDRLGRPVARRECESEFVTARGFEQLERGYLHEVGCTKGLQNFKPPICGTRPSERPIRGTGCLRTDAWHEPGEMQRAAEERVDRNQTAGPRTSYGQRCGAS
jgi:hypothetical protein